MKQSHRREKELLEAKVVKRALGELQVPAVKLKPGGQTGWPDHLFFVGNGRILLIEFKWGDFEPSLRQEYIHTMLRELGYDVQVHNNEDEALRAIQRAKEMGAACVPEKGGKVLARKRRGGIVP